MNNDVIYDITGLYRKGLLTRRLENHQVRDALLYFSSQYRFATIEQCGFIVSELQGAMGPQGPAGPTGANSPGAQDSGKLEGTKLFTIIARIGEDCKPTLRITLPMRAGYSASGTPFVCSRSVTSEFGPVMQGSYNPHLEIHTGSLNCVGKLPLFLYELSSEWRSINRIADIVIRSAFAQSVLGSEFVLA